MKEIRSIDNAEFRVLQDSREITGYALLFNTESRYMLDKNGWFKEIISPTALNGVLERSDVLALFNHDDNRVLARNTAGTGTLSLTIDEKGLKYSFYAPNTSIGDELYDAILRGDLRNSSFAFTIAKDGEVIDRTGDVPLRTITKFDRIYDVSPCWVPAYNDTTVAARSIKNDEVDMIDEKIEEIRDVSINVSVEVEDDATEDAIEDQNEDAMMEPDEMQSEPEMIDIIYDGNTYQIDKCIIQDQIDDKQLQDYIDSLELEIEQLKK